MIPKGEQWDEIAGLSSGDLSVTSYAVLLAAMARAGRTSVLKLSRKPVEKKVFLAAGRPVECRSNLAHETLGRFLLSENLLSPEAHRSALSDSLSRGIPLGEVLIENQLLSPHEVYRSLQKNLARKLLDGFTWERGHFEVVDDSGDLDPAVKVNPLQLILTGVSKLTPRAEIDAGIKGFRNEPLGLLSHPIAEGMHLRLSGLAQRVVRALESQPMDLEGLTSAVSLPAEDVERVVYGLTLAGRLLPVREMDEGPSGRQPSSAVPAAAHGETPVVERPEAAPADTVDDQALLLRRATVVEAYLSFQRKDSFDFFGLEEGATASEIDHAYLQLAEVYAPWSLAATGDFAEQGEILFLKAAEAYAELRNSESRGALIHRRRVLREEKAARKKPKFSIETDLLDSEEQFKKGLALAERGEPGRAIELLEFAVDCDPQNALYRAELAYRRDQFDALRYRKQSLADLKEAIRIDPGCGLGYYYLGLILAEEGDLASAEETLRRSIKLMAPDRRPIEALKKLAAKKRR